MTTSFEPGVIPEWDTGDRMRKTLRTTGISVGEMADYLDVTRETISRWINGRGEPSVQTLRLWSFRTGVPFAWLRNGESPRPDGDPNGGSAECAARDSNPEPAD